MSGADRRIWSRAIYITEKCPPDPCQNHAYEQPRGNQEPEPPSFEDMICRIRERDLAVDAYRFKLKRLAP